MIVYIARIMKPAHLFFCMFGVLVFFFENFIPFIKNISMFLMVFKEMKYFTVNVFCNNTPVLIVFQEFDLFVYF